LVGNEKTSNFVEQNNLKQYKENKDYGFFN